MISRKKFIEPQRSNDQLVSTNKEQKERNNAITRANDELKQK